MCRDLKSYTSRNVFIKHPPPLYTVWLIVLYRLLSPGALELLEALLSMDPLKRPSAAEALEFNYFKTELPEPVMPAK